MKKILLILALFCALGSSAQPGYTYIAQRYQWLAGLFRALGLPAGPGPAAFESGQAQRAGSVYYDSSGIDQGLYIFDGSTWVAAGSSPLTAGEGMALSGDSIHLGGLINAPPPLFSQNRLVNTNRKGLYFINGTIPDLVEPGGVSWGFGQEVFSPYQFLSRDTVPANDVDPPTAAVPWSGVHARRELIYPTGVFRTQKVFGHTLEMRWKWDDTLSLNTQGGDYNTGVAIDNYYEPYGTDRQGIRASHGTGQNLSIAYAAPALLVRNFLRNDGSNYIKVNGHLSGVNSYLIGSSNDSLSGYVYYTTGAFFGGHIGNVYDFAPGTRHPPPFADSAFLIFDTSVFKRNYFAGKAVIGKSKGTANTWSSEDDLKVLGNFTTTDTVVVGARNTITDTTGVDLILRRRTTGGLVSIRPDEWFAFNSVAGHGLDNVLAINQALTADRSTPTSAFKWDLTSSSTSRTLGLINTGVSGAGLFASATNTLGVGIRADGTLYAANLISNNIPLRLDMDRAATANGIEINRTYSLGNGSDGMVGNVYEHNLENDAGTLTAVHALQTKLIESGAGNETASVQVQVKHNGAFEDYLDMQTAGIVRTNNNADTLATRAYARSLISGGGAVWGAISGTLSDQTDLQTALNAKANTTLNNLASVAVNTTIASDADNTDDLGTSSNSWKDIYTRTVKYDGATSGTVTVQAETNAISPLVTVATGQGYGCSCMEVRETSDFTGQNVNTVQPMFNTAIDVWPLQASTSYDFEGFLSLNHGATSHSVGLSFELSGGASITSISYMTLQWVTAIGTQTASQTSNFVQVATNVAVNAAGANATEQIFFKGTISMNDAGNVTPSYTFSAAPGGTVLTKAGSYIKFCPKGTNTFTNIGPAN